MTDAHTDPTALSFEASERLERSLMRLLVARILLALVVISVVLFLFRWSSAVRRDTITAPVSQVVIMAPAGQQAPDDWKVVIPEYAGGGRGSTLIALKPWKFGTMQDHPLAVVLTIAVAVLAAGAFAGCMWYASRLKNPPVACPPES
jgi:hypothetical protein